MATITLEEEDLKYLRDLRARVDREMFGIGPVINALIIGLVMRGHVLLEGNPGLGKTALVRALSRAMGFGDTAIGTCARKSVGRIQFTPDLMPSDITGTEIPNDDRLLEFKHGPIFANLLLADEINRATPKTQAAMLEAMAEFQVTVLGQTYPLVSTESVEFRDRHTVSYDAQTPFLVMATQNPVDQDGTNPLPEAQLDRFLFKVRMPFPQRATLEEIIVKEVTGQWERVDYADLPTPDETLMRLHRLGAGLRTTEPTDIVRQHVLNMVLASVKQYDGVVGLTDRGFGAMRDFCEAEVTYPLGPRAARDLMLATLGWAAVEVVAANAPDQIGAKSAESLAAVVVPVLRHRLKFQSDFGGYGDDNGLGESRDDRRDALTRKLAILTAPQQSGYSESFTAQIEAAARTVRF